MQLWGLELIRALQAALESPGLTALVKAISALGTELFYLPALFFIFWCIDEKRGFRLGCLVLFSAWLNFFFKGLLQQPRPYNLDPQVGRAFEPSYGLPSGHAQNSLVFLIPLMTRTGGPGGDPAKGGGGWIFRGLAVFLLLLIAFTRLYLGVHFPTDILAGWLVGGLLLTINGLWGNRAAALLNAGGRRVQLIVVAALVLGMNALYPGDKRLGGLLLGFAGGYILMRRKCSFSAGAQVRGKKPGPVLWGIRSLAGLAGVVLIYRGLGLLFPGEGSLFAEPSGWGPLAPYRELGLFIRSGLMGLWVSAGAPGLFFRLGLAGTGKGPAPEAEG
jgi:membrane-associated phospholipid phosphatase